MSTPDPQQPVTINLARTEARDLTAAADVPHTVQRQSTIRQQKESAARWVAYVITGTFAAASALMLIGGFVILLLRPSEAKALLNDAAMPYLEKAGIFLSSTFGPLLAFVLGYYFGKSKDGSGTE